MRIIGSGQVDAEMHDRMKPAEVVFELAGSVFERPGRYEFVLHANDRLVGQESFEVLRLDRSSGVKP